MRCTSIATARAAAGPQGVPRARRPAPRRAPLVARAPAARGLPDLPGAPAAAPPSARASALALGSLAAGLAGHPLGACAAELGVFEGSSASYNVILGLFAMSVPGVWSLVKRSAKKKPVLKVYQVMDVADGDGSDVAFAQRLAAFFFAKNYEIVGEGDVVAFEGEVRASKGVAAFLNFCVLLTLGGTALVLDIAVPQVGAWWYALTLLSPLAGKYYLDNADTVERAEFKLVFNAEGEAGVVNLRMRAEKELMESVDWEAFLKSNAVLEKGKVYVPSIQERLSE